jgi:hypothetical protein
MKRNFGALASGSAASVNSGTIGIQKDKVVYLDPNTEILYDPALNVRNAKRVNDDIEGLIGLRLAMDATDQLQNIRVYPLPANKLDAKKPQMKYGVAYGHRRMLACRLTKKDDPEIGDMPRKVAAIIDVEWLTRLSSARLRSQIDENNERDDLNFVELGEAIQAYRRELEKEQGRSIPQRELHHEFKKLKEKTLGYLIQAADFHDLAKMACHDMVLTDLDSLVTYDAICKVSEEFAKAIYGSLLDETAPRTRALIRQAKTKIELEPDFTVDPETWVWPDSVAPQQPKQQPAVLPSLSLVQNQPVNAPLDSHAGVGSGSNSASGSQAGVGKSPESNQTSNNPPQAGGNNSKQEETPTAPPQTPAAETGNAQQLQPGGQVNGALGTGSPASTKGAVIIVSFKMGADAKNSFNGELLPGHKAKSPNMGVVAYLADGKEEKIEVPLKFIELVSISHT